MRGILMKSVNPNSKAIQLHEAWTKGNYDKSSGIERVVMDDSNFPTIFLPRKGNLTPEDQIAALWVSAEQPKARNISGSLFFIGDSLYSEGYLIGRLYTAVTGERFALISGQPWRGSWSHFCAVMRGIEGVMRTFVGPTPEDPQDMLAFFEYIDLPEPGLLEFGVSGRDAAKKLTKARQSQVLLLKQLIAGMRSN